ncbi:hypothetical protein GCM10007100_01280 [Roseibacillus persicicus]|uniref:Uncharacterized protein n=1 Tax=Roseibacillus persicicus TaxID=454148 RepID=A0A918TDC0_9BACT|nr:hypothetical protein GCM10007100_01280 [Roseibacillus persicicus]
MLVRKIWDDRLTPVKESGSKLKPVTRLGLGGALSSTTERNRRLGRNLGWGSFWSMIVVVAMIWIRWGLMAMGLDFTNGVAGLETTMFLLGALAVMVSHLLLFVCDHLTGGDTGPSVWALAIFWGGVVVGPFFVNALEMVL